MAQEPKQMILVCGATGKQGGAVIDALLKDGKFAVRGLSRNSNSDRCIQLRNSGVDIVRGDLSDKDSIKRALSGCYGMFLMTDFTTHGLEKEIEQGQNAIDAAKELNLQHVVFSATEDTNMDSGGKWVAPHFIGKARIAEYLQSAGGLCYTILVVSLFMENLSFLLDRSGDNWVLDVPTGSAAIPMTAVQDIGRMAAKAFAEGQKYTGQKIRVISDEVNMSELAQKLTTMCGRHVQLTNVSMKDFAARSRFHDNLAQMYGWFIDRQPFAGRSKEFHEILPEATSIDQWLQQDPCNIAASTDRDYTGSRRTTSALHDTQPRLDELSAVPMRADNASWAEAIPMRAEGGSAGMSYNTGVGAFKHHGAQESK